MFEVTVTAQVAFTRIDGGGTRRVRLADGTVHMFSRFPTRFEVVPPEVAADAHLVVRAVAAEEAASPALAPAPAAAGSDAPGATTAPNAPGDPAGTEKKGDRVQIYDGVPVADLDLSGWEYAELVKLAKELLINPFGKKKDELREELSTYIAAMKA